MTRDQALAVLEQHKGRLNPPDFIRDEIKRATQFFVDYLARELTLEAANDMLKKHSFRPGIDKTADRDCLSVAEIKAACEVVADAKRPEKQRRLRK